MTKLLDARTSQNASYGQSIATVLPPQMPTPIGVVGLNVTDAFGIIRVTFNGIAAIDILTTPPPDDKIVAIGVVRGTTANDPIVGYALYPFSAVDMGIKVVNLTLSDYNVPHPASNELVYSLILFSSSGGTRIGPESFNAAAYSD
jgi:hypothetical protein